MLAAVAALSLFLLQAQAGAFHTHALADDHHDDHRHGPAIHHHDASEAGEEQHFEDGDSFSNIITVAVPNGTVVIAAAVLYAESVEVIDCPPLQEAGRAPAIVTRSHDPPAVSHGRLRGPPVLPTL